MEPVRNLRGISNGKQPTPTRLLRSTLASMPKLQPAIQRLCSMKNRADFTPHQVETWVAALSIFDPRDVNQSILEIGLSVDPFPDLGKVLMACDRKRRERSGTQLKTDSNGKPSASLVAQVAKAMELEI